MDYFPSIGHQRTTHVLVNLPTVDMAAQVLKTAVTGQSNNSLPWGHFFHELDCPATFNPVEPPQKTPSSLAKRRHMANPAS